MDSVNSRYFGRQAACRCCESMQLYCGGNFDSQTGGPGHYPGFCEEAVDGEIMVRSGLK